MRSVNVAELKNRLSAYLNEVRKGEEILIRDRNLPIARIVPINQAEDLDAELLSLAAAGKPAPEIPTKKIVAALRSDRDED